MIEKFKNNLLRPKKIQSLYIWYNNTGNARCNMVCVENIKSDFIPSAPLNDILLEEAFQKLDLNIPVVVTIDGKGVVHKKIEIKPKISVFNQTLPNAKESDFYVQQYDIGNTSVYVSLVRKETTDQLLDLFHKKGIYVINLFLGPFQLETFAKYFDKPIDYVLQNTVINFINGKIHIKETGETSDNLNKIEIAGEEIKACEVIQFAGAVTVLSGISNTYFINIQPPVKYEEFRNKKIFVSMGWFMLISFLSILLINFALYSHYNNIIESSQIKLGLGEGILAKIDTLKQEYETRKKLTDKGNLSGNSFFSLYSDRLAFCMPSEITLIEMRECPVAGKIKDNAEMNFEKNKIEIKGLTPSSVYVNQWIKAIENEKWISKVDIISYGSDVEAKTGCFEITCQIIPQDVR